MFRPIAEIYEDPDIKEHASWFDDIHRDGGIEQCLEKANPLGTLATEAAVLSHVESLSDYDHKQEHRRRAVRLLGSLPTHVLVHNLGVPITAWTYANDHEERATALAENLATIGFDPDLLSKARSLALEDNRLPTSSDLLTHNRVMESMSGSLHEAVDLPAALQRSARQGVQLRASRLKDYELHPLRAKEGIWTSGYADGWPDQDKVNGQEGLSYRLWLDTPTGFGLFYKGVPQLEIGAVAKGQNELQVRQMQRIYGKYYDPADRGKGVTGLKPPRGLMPVDWQKLALDIAAQAAMQLDMSNVGILAGKRVPTTTAHISKEKAIELYDGTAARLKFKPDERGDWHMPALSLVA